MTQSAESDGAGQRSGAKKQEVILAFFDVLGFSKRVEDGGLEPLYATYMQLVDLVRTMVERDSCVIVSVPLGDGKAARVAMYIPLSHAYASDTFLLWAPYREDGFPAFCRFCAEFLCRALELGLPLRGAISMGEAIIDMDNHVFIGMPLVESACAEKEQQWVGIGFGASLGHEKYRRIMDITYFIQFRDHIKPGKEAVVMSLAVDWARHWRETRERDVHEVLNDLDVDPSEKVRTIYETTRRYVDFSAANADWFERLPAEPSPAPE